MSTSNRLSHYGVTIRNQRLEGSRWGLNPNTNLLALPTANIFYPTQIDTRESLKTWGVDSIHSHVPRLKKHGFETCDNCTLIPSGLFCVMFTFIFLYDVERKDNIMNLVLNRLFHFKADHHVRAWTRNGAFEAIVLSLDRGYMLHHSSQ